MKKFKIGMMSALAFSICLGLGGIKSYAKVNSILVKDATSAKIYEYNYSNLSDSFEDSMVGSKAPLYDDYSSKTKQFSIYGIYDDTNKYVDYSKVEDAYETAMLNKQPFNINDFTSSANAPLLANTPTTVTDVAVSSTGTLTFTDKTIGTNPDSSDFSVISIE